MKTKEKPQTDKYGTQRYYNSDGQLHRDNDLPAVIYEDGTKIWYKNGQRHRDDDEPAAIWASGTKYWYKNGQLHRDNDSPAAIWASGTKHYYLKNIYLAYDEYKSIINKTMTIKKITKETNIEKRRLYIEYYGLEKYIIDSKAKIISQDEYGVLYKKTQKDDEDIIMVKVKNSTPEHDGTYKFYFIRVPPNIACAREAVAWTFGMLEKEYSPSVES